MSGASLLAELAVRGVHVAAEGGRLRYVDTSGGAVRFDAVSGHRLELLRALVERARDRRFGDLARTPRSWPDDLREAFEERAAIMEFDGGLTRDEAELWAELSARERRAEAIDA